MENNDLGLWQERRAVIVLEGMLVSIPTRSHGLLRKKVETAPASEWAWSRNTIGRINYSASKFNMVIDVVTFLSQEVADTAAEWLLKYDVRVSGVEFFEFDLFCQALSWKPDVERVIDSSHDRLSKYGIKAYETMFGGPF
jgi:hypothetical protein